MRKRRTVSSDKRPLAQERTTAVRRRQEEISAPNGLMKLLKLTQISLQLYKVMQGTLHSWSNSH